MRVEALPKDWKLPVSRLSTHLGCRARSRRPCLSQVGRGIMPIRLWSFRPRAWCGGARITAVCGGDGKNIDCAACRGPCAIRDTRSLLVRSLAHVVAPRRALGAARASRSRPDVARPRPASAGLGAFGGRDRVIADSASACPAQSARCWPKHSVAGWGARTLALSEGCSLSRAPPSAKRSKYIQRFKRSDQTELALIRLKSLQTQV